MKASTSSKPRSMRCVRKILRWRSPSRSITNVKIKAVRHQSHATYSRQPRQVRKEATVTGSYVCSGSPVPDLLLSHKAQGLVGEVRQVGGDRRQVRCRNSEPIGQRCAILIERG